MMSILSNFMTKELRNNARLKNVNGYKNTRSRNLQMLFKISILKNFAIYTRKHVLESLFNKVAGQKTLQHRCFLVNIKKFFKYTFFTEQPRTTTSSSAPISTPTLVSRSRPRPAIRVPSIPRPRPRRTPEPPPIDKDEIERMEMAKTRPIPENTWYQWNDWLVKHFPESMKKSESNTKQKVINLFESKIDYDTPTDYKPKKIKDAFEGKYVE